MPNEIIPGLYVSSLPACRTWEGGRICVAEQPCHESSECEQLPIRTASGLITIVRLDAVYAEVVHMWASGLDKVLLHCEFGVERAPLAATWVVSRHRKISLDQAWEIVHTHRTDAQDRRGWITAGG